MSTETDPCPRRRRVWGGGRVSTETDPCPRRRRVWGVGCLPRQTPAPGAGGSGGSGVYRDRPLPQAQAGLGGRVSTETDPCPRRRRIWGVGCLPRQTPAPGAGGSGGSGVYRDRPLPQAQAGLGGVGCLPRQTPAPGAGGSGGSGVYRDRPLPQAQAGLGGVGCLPRQTPAPGAGGSGGSGVYRDRPLPQAQAGLGGRVSTETDPCPRCRRVWGVGCLPRQTPAPGAGGSGRSGVYRDRPLPQAQAGLGGRVSTETDPCPRRRRVWGVVGCLPRQTPPPSTPGGQQPYGRVPPRRQSGDPLPLSMATPPRGTVWVGVNTPNMRGTPSLWGPSQHQHHISCVYGHHVLLLT